MSGNRLQFCRQTVSRRRVSKLSVGELCCSRGIDRILDIPLGAIDPIDQMISQWNEAFLIWEWYKERHINFLLHFFAYVCSRLFSRKDCKLSTVRGTIAIVINLKKCYWPIVITSKTMVIQRWVHLLLHHYKTRGPWWPCIAPLADTWNPFIPNITLLGNWFKT